MKRNTKRYPQKQNSHSYVNFSQQTNKSNHEALGDFGVDLLTFSLEGATEGGRLIHIPTLETGIPNDMQKNKAFLNM